jgi:hypothetical protein
LMLAISLPDCTGSNDSGAASVRDEPFARFCQQALVGNEDQHPDVIIMTRFDGYEGGISVTLSRRTFLRTGQLTAVAGVLAAWQPVAASQATPAATPEGASSPPEALYQWLLSSTITSPLFPSDYGPLAIVEWVDDSDTDLDGVIGGLLVQDTTKGDADDAVIAACIVHPTAESAIARLTATTDDETRPVEILGRQGVWVQAGDYSLLGVVEGSVIISAIGSSGEERAPDGPAVSTNGETDFRALANLAGMLDHMRMVLMGSDS